MAAFAQILVDMGLNTAQAEAALAGFQQALEAINEITIKQRDGFAITTEEIDKANKNLYEQVKLITDVAVKASEHNKDLVSNALELVKYQETVLGLIKARSVEEVQSLATEQARLQVLQAQLEAREQAAAIPVPSEKKPEEKESFVSGLGAGLASGLPSFLKLSSAAAVGELGGEAVWEGIKKVGEAIAEAADRSNRLVVSQGLYNNLVKQAGIDGPQMMEKMKEGTEGLVKQVDLLGVANVALRSPVNFSQGQIEKLVALTTKLAAANNHGATAITSLTTALERGNPAMLARTVGLNGHELQLRNISSLLSDEERQTLEWNNALKVLETQAAKLGNIPKTLEDVKTQFDNLLTDSLDQFAAGFITSPEVQQSMQDFSTWMSSMGDWTTKMHDLGSEAGRSAANVTLLVDALKAFKTLVLALVQPIVDLKTAVRGLSDKDAFDFATSWSGQLIGAAALFKGVAAAATYLYATIKAGIGNPLGNAKALEDFTASLRRIKQEEEEAILQYLVDQKKFEDARAKGEGSGTGGPAGPKTPGPVNEKVLQQIKQAKDAYNKELLHQQELADNESFAQWRAQLTRRAELEKQMYAQGLEEQSKFFNNKAVAAQDQYDLEVATAVAAERRTVAAINNSIASAKKDKLLSGQALTEQLKTFGKQIEDAQTTRFNATAAAQRTYDATILTLNGERAANTIATERAISDAVLQEVQQRNSAVQKAAAYAFAQHKIGAEEYAQAEIDSIREIAAAETQHAKDAYKSSPQTDPGGVQLQASLDAITAKTKAQLLDLAHNFPTVYAQALTEAFDKSMAIQGEKLQYQASQNDFQGQLNTLISMSAELAKQRQELQDQFDINTGNVEVQYKYYQNIVKIAAEQHKYTEDIKDLTSYMTRAGGLLSGVGTLFSHAGLGNVGTAFSVGGQALEKSQAQGRILGNQPAGADPELQKLRDKMQAAFDGVKDAVGPMAKTIQAFNDAIDATTTETVTPLNTTLGTFEDAVRSAGNEVTVFQQKLRGETSPGLFDGEGNQIAPVRESISVTGDDEDASPSIPGFGQHGITQPDTGKKDDTEQTFAGITQKGVALIGALDGMAQAVFGAKDALSGGIGGGLSGAGAGNAIGQMAGQFGKDFGGAIGAAVGLVSGIIIGKKNAEIQKKIDGFNASMKEITHDLATNAVTLQDTILRMQSLLQDVQAQQSNSGKKGKSYTDTIDKYKDQIQQLQDQQEDIIKDLHKQLTILSTDPAMRDVVTTLQDINDQYDKFKGAARNTQELADAQDWLNKSMADYQSQISDELLSGQIQAVQDAQNLNDLLKQRAQDESDLLDMLQQRTDLQSQLNDLLDQRNQYEEDYQTSLYAIMTQGAATRTFTQAQSVGQQIQKLQDQYTKQLAQVDKQKDAYLKQIDKLTEQLHDKVLDTTLDAQIDAAQKRVDAEKQIYDIVTQEVDDSAAGVAAKVEAEQAISSLVETRLSLEQALATNEIAMKAAAAKSDEDAMNQLIAQRVALEQQISDNRLQTEQMLAAHQTQVDQASKDFRVAAEAALTALVTQRYDIETQLAQNVIDMKAAADAQDTQRMQDLEAQKAQLEAALSANTVALQQGAEQVLVGLINQRYSIEQQLTQNTIDMKKAAQAGDIQAMQTLETQRGVLEAQLSANQASTQQQLQADGLAGEQKISALVQARDALQAQMQANLQASDVAAQNGDIQAMQNLLAQRTDLETQLTTNRKAMETELSNQQIGTVDVLAQKQIATQNTLKQLTTDRMTLEQAMAANTAAMQTASFNGDQAALTQLMTDRTNLEAQLANNRAATEKAMLDYRVTAEAQVATQTTARLNPEWNLLNQQQAASSSAFVLTQNKVALETELLRLQGIQSDKDIAKLAALQQVLAQMQAGSIDINMIIKGAAGGAKGPDDYPIIFDQPNVVSQYGAGKTPTMQEYLNAGYYADGYLHLSKALTPGYSFYDPASSQYLNDLVQSAYLDRLRAGYYSGL